MQDKHLLEMCAKQGVSMSQYGILHLNVYHNEKASIKEKKIQYPLNFHI